MVRALGRRLNFVKLDLCKLGGLLLRNLDELVLSRIPRGDPCDAFLRF